MLPKFVIFAANKQGVVMAELAIGFEQLNRTLEDAFALRLQVIRVVNTLNPKGVLNG